MKAIRYFFKEILYPASFTFTIYVFILYFLSWAVKTTNVSATVVQPVLLLAGYIYFVIVSSANKIFRTSLEVYKCVIIHYILLLLPFIGVLAFAGNKTSSSPFSFSTIVIVAIVYSIIYAIIMTPVLLIRKGVRAKKEEEEVYESQFGN